MMNGYDMGDMSGTGWGLTALVFVMFAALLGALVIWLMKPAIAGRGHD